MNPRSNYSRSRDSKLDPSIQKSGRNRHLEEDDHDHHTPISRRYPTERPRRILSSSSSYSRFKDDRGDRGRTQTPYKELHNSLIFRRQERGKFHKFSKNSTPETSPRRSPDAEHSRGDYSSRHNYGSVPHYRNSNYGHKEYAPRRSERVNTRRVFDDARFANFLARLQRDEDHERQAGMIIQLKEIFSEPENLKVIISNLDMIIDAFDDLLQVGYFSDYKKELAASLGMLGSVLGSKAKELLEWAFQLYNASKNEEIRVLIFKALLEMLKYDKEKQHMAELMAYIMLNIQSALEVADNPDLLMAIVDIIFEISDDYPKIFSNHFSDTVDILIGWHIDMTQQPYVTAYTSKALIHFQQFWLYDIKFTLTLLGQFLEDMESYAEDLPKSGSVGSSEDLDQATPGENLTKIYSLIRVLTTVLKSIGYVITPDDNGLLTWNFMIKMMKNFLTCVMMTVDYYFYFDLLTSANQCLCLLLKQLQSHSLEALDLLVKYIAILQNQKSNFLSEQYILSMLELMTEFVKTVDTRLPVEFVSNLFLETSSTYQLKFSRSLEVQQHVLSLQHAILNVKNVQAVEEFYEHICIDAIGAFKVLSKLKPDDDDDDFDSLEKARVTLLSCLSALVEIGNAKNSIIRMWALKPTFFDLMTEKLKPTTESLAVNSPPSQYAILFTLYSHSQRHKHFISNSSLVNRHTGRRPQSSSGHSSPILSNVLIPPQNSEHLSKIIILLIELLSFSEISYDVRLLGIQWCFEITKTLQQHLSKLVNEANFLEFINVVINTAFQSNSTKVSKICSLVLQRLLESAGLSLTENIFHRCYELCLLKLNAPDNEIQDHFASVMTLLPINIIIGGGTINAVKAHVSSNLSVSTKGHGINSSDSIWSILHSLMNKSSSLTIPNHHFKAITGFILQGTKPLNDDWLLRLLYSCPLASDCIKMEKLNKDLCHLAEKSLFVLWFWSTWEVAQMCVINKLRTTLGKPQETFMAIEGALKSCLKPPAKQDMQFSDDKEDRLLRVHLLLQLMEHLEKLMYNAYEGCAYALPSSPKTVRTFFRTNKATCLEWLSRVRITMCSVALSAGQPVIALKSGYELLTEMKAQRKTEDEEFENVLVYIIKALIQLRCPEAILGLYVWCKEKLGQKFTWIKAAVDQAAGRFELAAHEYFCILHSLKNSQSPCKNKVLKDLMKPSDKLKNGTSVTLGFDNNTEDIVKVLDQLSVKDSIHLPEPDPHFHSFLVNQISECYINLGSWAGVAKWMDAQEKVKFSQNGMTGHNNVFPNLSYLRSLTVFDDEEQAFDSSGHLDSKSLKLTSPVSDWIIQDQVHAIQKMLLSSAVDYKNKAPLSFGDEMEEIKYDVLEARSKLLQLMKITCLDWPPQVNPHHASLFSAASAIISLLDGTKNHQIFLDDNIKLDPINFCCSTLTSTLAWQQVVHHLVEKDASVPSENDTLVDLLLVSARLARKQQNLKLSQKLLLKSSSQLFGSNLDLSTIVCHKPQTIDVKNLKEILNDSLMIKPSKRIIKMQREGAKLLHSAGESESAYDFLLQSCLAVSSKINEEFANDHLNNQKTVKALCELNSRSLLTVVKYLQQDNKNANDISIEVNQELITKTGRHSHPVHVFNTVIEIEKLSDKLLTSPDSFSEGSFLERENIVGEIDYFTGRLLMLSVKQCPALPKAWCAFASWCYRWGKKVIDAAGNNGMDLLPDEESKILSLVPNASADEIDALLCVVTSLHRSSGNDWDNQEMDYGENGIDETRQQLLNSCPFLLKVTNFEDVVETLLDIWKTASDRVYYYYKMAAKSYLQYLKLTGQTDSTDHSEDDNVTATLRLLRLIVKHALELREVLEDGLAQTPTAPWRGIIPQLFSRLNHPEPYVRQSISDLLCRVAQASPHLIVYPAVVGSLTLKAGHQLPEETSVLFGAYFPETIEEPSSLDSEKQINSPSLDQEILPSSIPSVLSDEEETEEDHQKTAIMQNCFAALVETLGRQDGRTISEVKNLVHELHRITVLWDELWLGTLNLHHSEVNRRISNLEKEITKVVNNTHLSKEEKKDLIREKHNVYIKPTLFVLEQLQSITSQPAETPHELWFQKTFEKNIETALNKLKNPIDPSQPQDSWLVFRKLHQVFQQKLRQARTPLQMQDISPTLSALTSTVIPMPGITKKDSGIVMIQSVSNIVSILPTKTKPKKLSFIGSDGQKYGYLFKGLEDLHLDERIMQFLSIVNNMFAKNRKNGKEIYNARHYSVTPLGPRSGLIQWVDGATALFSLYKKWQQREAIASTIKGQATAVANVLRPSEVYYNKLTPLLKEKGLNHLENRKEWPLNILLEVIKELMDETPNDLLAKELWCHCGSAFEWWSVTQTYNHSTAVMSVIGYIIGLGDRHLDNVLVDLATGEVVHIDYNVCFEKGKNLRVPEKVPFRMTPNIETALGVTGVEGVFRISCEHVLKVLRKGRETLLTLLEAFVYDPLVDWTPGNDGGYTGAMYGGRQVWATDSKLTRQDMEIDIAWSMFSIRVTEMKGEWINNRDELLAALPKLENLLEAWEEIQLQLQIAESQLQEACLEKALLEEAQSNPNHHLYSLPKRFEEISAVKSTVKATQEAIQEKSAEYTKWHNLHCDALVAVCGTELSKWCEEAASAPMADTLSVAPVVEFLQTAGQGQLVQQCEHLESELGNVLQQHRLAIRNCVDLLTTYATIVKQFGPQFKEHGRNFRWREWLEILLKDFTVAKCQETVTEFHTLYTMESVGVATIQSAVSLNFQLQDAIGELNSKLHNFYERQLMDGVQDKNAFAAVLEETKCAMLQFVSENSQQNHLSLLCIFVTAFCGIYKRLMMMEKSALAAGESLVDLTSYGGYWFLDEMYSTCSNITEFVRLLIDSWPTLDSEAKANFNGVHLAYCIFSSLEDLSFNFQNIILPEAIQRSLEPSVIEMITKLDRIIARCGVSLDRLISELEANTRSIILETQITENWVNDVVKKLRNEFESLMKKTEPQISDLNHGQMLLMAFNGLFTKLDSDLDLLLNFLDSQTIPTSWKKLDVFRDTVAFAPFVHNHATRSIMKDIYFLRKLIVIQQFFHYCHEYVSILQLVGKQDKNCAEVLLASEYSLIKPIKLFTAEYVRHMVLGLPSQTLGFTICLLIGHLGFNLNAEIEMRDVGAESKIFIEDIGKKSVDICANEHFLQAQLPAAGELTSNFDAAWRKMDSARRLEQNILICKSSLQRMQLQLARFQWLNEDLLVLGNIGPLQNFAIPTRASVMSEMRKIVQTLLAYESAIAVSQERYLAVTSSIEQRLKWAKGANPSLTDIQEEFEDAIEIKTTAVSNANQLSRELVSVCNAILHFEALRTRTTEALSSDTSFLSLMTRCQESCLVAESCKSCISIAEEHLVELQPLPEKGVNSDWISLVMENVTKSLCSSKEKLEQTKALSFASWESLSCHVAHLHDLLSSHHKLMSEVRHILRNLAKHEEQNFVDAKPEGTIFSYISVYKQFSEQILSIVNKLLTEGQDMGMNRLSEIKDQIPQISVSVAEVFNKLLELAGNLGNCTSVKASGVLQRRKSDPCQSSLLTPQPPEKNGIVSSLGFGALPRTPQRCVKQKKAVTRDPRTGKALQERNSYATNVWKRVKIKLDGRDPDLSRKSTISEQVDFIIKEATNLENLAVLYEGWTPWV